MDLLQPIILFNLELHLPAQLLPADQQRFEWQNNVEEALQRGYIQVVQEQ